MPSRRLIASVPLLVALAAPGAAQAQGRVYRIAGGRAPWALWQECM